MTALLKVFLTKFWPVLIPIILYILWRMYRRRYKKPEIYAEARIMLCSVAVVFIMCLVYVIYSTESSRETYVPNRVENGKLVPSRVENED